MRVQEIMKRHVECITPQSTVEEAARRMRDKNLGFLPVCHPDGTIAGTLTDRDITIRVVADKRGPDTVVEEAMTREEIVCCRPDDDLKVCEDLMARGQKSRIIVVDDQGKPVGVVSLSDIAKREEGGQAAQTLRQVADREARA